MSKEPQKIDLYDDILMGAVRKIRQTFRVSIPGKVVAFTRETSRVLAALGAKVLTTQRTVVDEPDAGDLPVITPRGGGYGMHFDLREGDPTFLIACDGPMRGFYETGEPHVPQNPLGHQYGCAVAFPGGRVSSSIPGQSTPPPNEVGTCWIGAEDGSSTIKFYGLALPNPTELGTMTVAVAAPTAALKLGSDNSADPVACANEVDANYQSLLTAIAAATCSPPNPIAEPAVVAIKAAFTAWSMTLQPVADLKARVDGPIPLP